MGNENVVLYFSDLKKKVVAKNIKGVDASEILCEELAEIIGKDNIYIK